MKKIAIIIPAYNEKKNLFKLVKKINLNIKKSQIFIIDDSPRNETLKTLKKFKNINFFYRGKKLGRGSAVLFGLKKAIKKKIEIFIEMDADFSHDPKELKSKINFYRKNNLDLLIASRYMNKSKIFNWSISRRVFSKFSNFLAKLLLKIPVSDYTNGFRIYSKKAVKIIVKRCGKIGDGFIVLSEILTVLDFYNCKIDEIETVFVNRKRGESSVNLKLVFASLMGLLKIYFLKKKWNSN